MLIVWYINTTDLSCNYGRNVHLWSYNNDNMAPDPEHSLCRAGKCWRMEFCWDAAELVPRVSMFKQFVVFENNLRQMLNWTFIWHPHSKCRPILYNKHKLNHRNSSPQYSYSFMFQISPVSPLSLSTESMTHTHTHIPPGYLQSVVVWVELEQLTPLARKDMLEQELKYSLNNISQS